MRQRPTVDVHGTSRTISAKNLNGPTDTQAAAFPGSVGSGRSGVVRVAFSKTPPPASFHSFLRATHPATCSNYPQAMRSGLIYYVMAK
jgi:hypothetical protein